MSPLLPLQLGLTESVDVQAIAKALKGQESRMTEKLQFALHSFCCQKKYGSREDEIVTSILRLCYSKKTINHIRNVEKFAACLTAILEFCYNRNLVECAIEVKSILEMKGEDLRTASVESNKVTDHLFVIGYFFLRLVVALAPLNSETTLKLFAAALFPFELITVANEKILDKFETQFSYAWHFLKDMDIDEAFGLIARIRKIMHALQGSKDNDRILNFLCRRVRNALIAFKEKDSKIKAINESLLLLQITGCESLKSDWIIIMDYFTSGSKNATSIDDCIKATKKISSKLKSRTDERLTILLMNFVKHYGYATDSIPVPIIKRLVNDYIWYLWKETVLLRNFSFSSKSCEVHLQAEVAQALASILMHCRQNFKHKTDEYLDVVNIFIDAFNECFECLSYLSENKIDVGQESTWTSLVASTCNLMEDLWTWCWGNSEWRYLQKLCRCVLPRLVTTKRDIPLITERLELIFVRWQTSSEKIGDWREAMLCRGLQIAVCSQDLEAEMVQLCKLKLMKGNQYKDFNICQFFKKEELKLTQLYPALDISTLDKKLLLLNELKAYRTISSPDLMAPMLNAWSALNDLKVDSLDTAIGFSCVVPLHVWGAPDSVIAKYLKASKEVLKKFSRKQGSSEARNIFYMGILKYCVLLCLMAKKKSFPAADYNDLTLISLKKEAEEKAKFGGDIDLNLTCDVAPVGCSSTLEDGVEIMRQLNEIVSCWETISNEITSDCLSSSEFSLLYEHLHTMANLASLYGATLISIKAWVLYARIAAKLLDLVSQLRAWTNLIRLSEISSDCKLVICAKEIYSNLRTTKDKKKEVVIEALMDFQLVIADSYLSDGLYSSALECLEEVKTLLNDIRSVKVFRKLKGQYLCALSKLLLAAPSLSSQLDDTTETNIQFTSYYSFVYIKTALGNKQTGLLNASHLSSLLLAMVDISLWCVNVFSSLRLTRYVRSYVEDLYVIFQNLDITYRTAQFLSILVNVDLTVGNLSDAQTKLTNLQTLLDITPLQEKSEPVQVWLQPPVEHHARDVSPVRCCKDPNDYSRSPLHLSRSISTSCWNHKPTCTCYLCHSLPMRQIIIAALLAEAMAESYLGNFHAASKLYSKGLSNLAKFDFNNYQDYIRELLQKISFSENSLFKSRSLDLLRTTFFTQYAAYLMLPEAKSEQMLTTLNKAGDYLSRLTYEKYLLGWRYTELLARLYISKEREKEVAPSKSCSTKLKLTVSSVTQTPRPTRGISTKEPPEFLAPKKNGVKSKRNNTGPILVKPGRRVFDDPPEESHETIKLEKQELTPVITKAPSQPAAQSVRPKATGKKLPQRKKDATSIEAVIIDSPEMPTVVKAKIGKSTLEMKGRKLQFSKSESNNEVNPRRSRRKIVPDAVKVISEEKSSEELNYSTDLFESFEKKLTIE